MVEKIYLTIPDVCEALSIGRTKVYRLLEQGESEGGLPSVHIGRARRIPAEAVRSWAERQIEAAAEATGSK